MSDAEEIESTTSLQRLVLALVHFRGYHGITWFELGKRLDWHHGRSSGALSGLHESGRIVRLAERRGRSGVYVTPDFVLGRPTVPYGRSRSNRSAYERGYADGLADGLRQST